MQKLNLLNQTFGNLFVLSEYPKRKNGHVAWWCICSCGSLKVMKGFNLARGDVKSCGHGREEFIATVSKTHGLSKSPEHRAWSDMKGRCTRPNATGYSNYGGRGIVVCERWKNSFEAFYSDMGERPSRVHSLDRINVNGHYEPSNCKWSTKSEQCKNQRRWQRAA